MFLLRNLKKDFRFLWPLLARLYKNTESYCYHFDVGIGVGITLKSFTLKFFLL